VKPVRYVSPFGSPATLDRARAAELLAQDAPLYALCDEVGILSERQRRIGAPRLDDPRFRLSDLPDWKEGDDVPALRPLVRKAENLARDRGEPYVVASRDGRSAVLPLRLLLEGDAVRWEAR
jgi:hypothetical protein